MGKTIIIDSRGTTRRIRGIVVVTVRAYTNDIDKDVDKDARKGTPYTSSLQGLGSQIFFRFFLTQSHFIYPKYQSNII